MLSQKCDSLPHTWRLVNLINDPSDNLISHCYDNIYIYISIFRTVPLATLSSKKERSRDVDLTWTPKNVAVLRNVNFTVEFMDTMLVATPEKSSPA